MENEILFMLAARLEHKAAECYEKISLLPAAKGTLAQDLQKLSQEEIVHANLLKSGQNYAASDPDLFEADALTEKDLRGYLASIEDLIRDVERKALTLPDALRRIHDLEILLEAAHLATVVKIKDPVIKKLFSALSQGDKQHKERLDQILQALASGRPA